MADLGFLDNTLDNLDVTLIRFYKDVIKDDLEANTLEENTEALSRLRSDIVQKVRGRDDSPINFQSRIVRCSYVFYFCPTFTGAVVLGGVNFLKHVPDLVVTISQRDSFVLCCLGGGPGTEVVAFYELIRTILTHYQRRGQPLTLKAIVVDSERGWEETSRKVVSKLVELANESNESLIQITFRFLVQDLTMPFSYELKDILKEADLVTIVKMFSALHGENTMRIRSGIVREVCGSMQEGSFLFLLDSSGWIHLHEVCQEIRSCQCMQQVFQPLKQTYSISGNGLMLCRQLYSDYFGSESCTSQSVNVVTAFWQRKS